MYDHSRTLYTELRPLLRPAGPDTAARRRLLLRACEGSVVRLVRDPHGPSARAAVEHLFADVRTLVRPSEQLTALRLIERRLVALRDALRNGASREGVGRCAAVNRRGAPCAREAVGGSRFCPSHRPPEERNGG